MAKPDALNASQTRRLRRERWALLNRLVKLSEKPMVVLSFIWLALLIMDLTQGLNPQLSIAVNVIWATFILDFAVQLLIAPDRIRYIRKNWVTAIAIALPALGMLRLFRAFRFLSLTRLARPLNMLRIITSLRRGIGALSKTFNKRGLGYVFALSTLVTFVGAAGIEHFESARALKEAGLPVGNAIENYPDAVWWTSMIMTTMGSQYWPQTLAGRTLGFLIAAYASIVYGYITASIASHFFISDRQEAKRKEALAAQPAVMGASGTPHNASAQPPKSGASKPLQTPS